MDGHYSPASVDGQGSAETARRLSRAYTDAYYRGKRALNQRVEQLGYLPPGQARDDLWSGGEADTRFWRAGASAVVSRHATGLTREQRSAVDGAQPSAPPGQGAPPAVFFEQTRARSGENR